MSWPLTSTTQGSDDHLEHALRRVGVREVGRGGSCSCCRGGLALLTSAAPTALYLAHRVHLRWLPSDVSEALAASGPLHSSLCLQPSFLCFVNDWLLHIL